MATKWSYDSKIIMSSSQYVIRDATTGLMYMKQTFHLLLYETSCHIAFGANKRKYASMMATVRW